MIELRWLLPPYSTTEPPRLQSRIRIQSNNIGGGPAQYSQWTDVPIETDREAWEQKNRVVNFAQEAAAFTQTYRTLKDQIALLVLQHGGWKELSKVLDMDEDYLLRLSSGETINPGRNTLAKLGLDHPAQYLVR